MNIMLWVFLFMAADGPPAGPPALDLLFTSNRTGNSEVYLLPAGQTEWINLSDDHREDNWGEWSPDGSKIAFQTRRNGNLDIWLMNADGSDKKPLTRHTDADYLPSWSPDGKQIAFVSWRPEPGDTEHANHIYIMNADGSDQRRLLPVSPGTSAGVEFAPDGKSLITTRKIGEQADLYVIDLKGNELRQLTDDEAYDGAATLSPDGTKIAFYSEADGTSKIVVMDIDGSNRVDIVSEGLNYYPRWSPDGAWITYCAQAASMSDYDVWAIRSDGSGEPVKLVSTPGREVESRWRPK